MANLKLKEIPYNALVRQRTTIKVIYNCIHYSVTNEFWEL